MKKIYSVLIGFLFSMLVVCGSAAAENNIEEKLVALERLEDKAFEWECVEWSPEYEQMVELAEKVYRQNLLSFNAAYNYGVLRYNTCHPELGLGSTEEHLRESLAAFEHARKLVPNKIMLFEREYEVLKLLLIGNDFPTRLNPNGVLFEEYSQHKEDAASLYYVISRLFQLNNIDRTRMTTYQWRDKALQAFLISLALQNGKEGDFYKAQVLEWLPAAGGAYDIKEAWRQEHKRKINLNTAYTQAWEQAGVPVQQWKKEIELERHIREVRAFQEQLGRALQNQKLPQISSPGK